MTEQVSIDCPEKEILTFPETAFMTEAHSLTNSHRLRLNLHGWLSPGRPDKVMVLVHGMGGHGGYYATSVAPYIAPTGVAVYAPDLRGHGRSEGKRGDIESFRLFQDDVATAV